MLAKSSKTPQGRILSLFDILSDWLAVPEIQVNLSSDSVASSQLVAFCTQQAVALGASNPAILAEHIVLIARNAVQQEIHQPGSGSLLHAKKAANALILAQTQNEWHYLKKARAKPAIYSIAASLFLLVAVSAIWLPSALHTGTQPALTKSLQNNLAKQTVATANTSNTKLSALDAATMYAKYEKMRNGTCQFPEAIQIPDKHKGIYLENVVAGKLPSNMNDLAIANAYLEKVRCNYTPMLMANSTS